MGDPNGGGTIACDASVLANDLETIIPSSSTVRDQNTRSESSLLMQDSASVVVGSKMGHIGPPLGLNPRQLAELQREVFEKDLMLCAQAAEIEQQAATIEQQLATIAKLRARLQAVTTLVTAPLELEK